MHTTSEPIRLNEKSTHTARDESSKWRTFIITKKKRVKPFCSVDVGIKKQFK